MYRRNPLGQNLVEVALCLAVVSMVFISMSIYVRRYLQARYKDGADYTAVKLEEAGVAGLRRQYEPYYRTGEQVEVRDSDSAVGFPNTVIHEEVNRSGTVVIGTVEEAN